jgi:hypothetical protein
MNLFRASFCTWTTPATGRATVRRCVLRTFISKKISAVARCPRIWSPSGPNIPFYSSRDPPRGSPHLSKKSPAKPKSLCKCNTSGLQGVTGFGLRPKVASRPFRTTLIGGFRRRVSIWRRADNGGGFQYRYGGGYPRRILGVISTDP